MHKHLNNTLIVGIDSIVLIISTLIAIPFLVHSLGLEMYGLFVFLNIFSIYGALLLFDFGLEGSVINYVARFDSDHNGDKVQSVFSSAFIFYALLGMVTAFIFYSFSGMIYESFSGNIPNNKLESFENSLRLIPILMILQFLSVAFSSVLEGMRRFHVTRGCNIVLNILQNLCITLVAIYTQDIEIVYWTLVIIALIRLTFLSMYMFFKVEYFELKSFRFDLDISRNLISYSGILFINRMIGFLFSQMDKFLILKFLTPAYLAIYDIVIKPANLVRVIISVLNSAVIPEVSKLDQSGDRKSIQSMYVDFIRYTYLIIFPIIVLFLFNMKYLLALWVGEELSLHYFSALILVLIYLFNPIPSIVSTIFVGLELVKKVIWISILGVIVNVFLSIFLVSTYKINGLLFATLIAEIIMLYPYLWKCSEILKLPMKAAIYPILKVFVVYLPLIILSYMLSSVTTPGVAFIGSIILLIASYIGAYIILLTNREKDLIKERIRLIYKKKEMSNVE